MVMGNSKMEQYPLESNSSQVGRQRRQVFRDLHEIHFVFKRKNIENKYHCINCPSTIFARYGPYRPFESTNKRCLQENRSTPTVISKRNAHFFTMCDILKGVYTVYTMKVGLVKIGFTLKNNQLIKVSALIMI